MTDPERTELLLAEYREAFARGESDPEPFLAQVEGDQRRELDGLIDQFLLTAPRQPFDANEYSGSRAENVVESISKQLGIKSGGWPMLLPSLRTNLQLKRSAVVAALAERLEAKGQREEAEVGDFYHAMEYGTLPPAGVSNRVLEALAAIYHTKVSTLREAGQAFEGTSGLDAGLIHTRQASDVAFRSPSSGQASPAFPPLHSMQDADFDVAAPGEPGPTRIERLFTEGDSSE